MFPGKTKVMYRALSDALGTGRTTGASYCKSHNKIIYGMPDNIVHLLNRRSMENVSIFLNHLETQDFFLYIFDFTDCN